MLRKSILTKKSQQRLCRMLSGDELKTGLSMQTIADRLEWERGMIAKYYGVKA